MSGHNGTTHTPTKRDTVAAKVINKAKQCLALLGKEGTQRNVGLYLIGVGISNARASGLSGDQIVVLMAAHFSATPDEDAAAKEAIVDLAANKEPA